MSGVRLLLKRSANGSERLVFATRDVAALVPSVGSADDPATGGALVEVFSFTTPSGAALDAPAGTSWKARDRAHDTFKFTNPAAPLGPSPVKVLSLRQGRGISLAARATGLSLTSPQGAVAIRITTGSLRNCALFAGAAVRRDRVGEFVGKQAPASALADCSDAALGVPTTTTSTTTTTLPPTCGDGVINQSSEQCDGADLGICGSTLPFVSCGVPGFSNACQCCAEDGVTEAAKIVPCCNPSSTGIEGTHAASCIPLRCDPPFTCAGNVCQADHTCCAPVGATCAVPLPVGLPFTFSCCPGLACAKLTSQRGACCVPDTAACTQDADCCSGHCGASGTCDVCDKPVHQGDICCSPSGAACTQDSDCCGSWSCGASGTCD